MLQVNNVQNPSVITFHCLVNGIPQVHCDNPWPYIMASIIPYNQQIASGNPKAGKIPKRGMVGLVR